MNLLVLDHPANLKYENNSIFFFQILYYPSILLEIQHQTETKSSYKETRKRPKFSFSRQTNNTLETPLTGFDDGGGLKEPLTVFTDEDLSEPV